LLYCARTDIEEIENGKSLNREISVFVLHLVVEDIDQIGDGDT
jgi:hypothetical protein